MQLTVTFPLDNSTDLYHWFWAQMAEQRSLKIEVAYHGEDYIQIQYKNRTVKQNCFKNFKIGTITKLKKKFARSYKIRNETVCFLTVQEHTNEYHTNASEDSLELPSGIVEAAIEQLTDYWIRNDDILDQYGRKRYVTSKIAGLDIIDTPWIDIFFDDLFYFLLREHLPVYNKQKFFLTFDLDAPTFTAGLTIKKVVKNLIGDLIKRADMKLFWRRLKNVIRVNAFNGRDNYDTLSILKLSNLPSSIEKYLFIISQTRSHYPEDPNYYLSNTYIRTMVGDYTKKNFKLGQHTSLLGSSSDQEFHHELIELQSQLKQMKIDQHRVNAHRSHFLKYDNRFLSLLLMTEVNEFGLGYCDRSGFRLGTCRPYFAFDFNRKIISKMNIVPLLAMDVTLLEPTYMNLNYENALLKLKGYMRVCYDCGGIFNLCWHNHRLENSLEGLLLNDLIEEYKFLNARI